MPTAIEINKDVAGGTNYASRNQNDIVHVVVQDQQSILDFVVNLRQKRTLKKSSLLGSSSEFQFTAPRQVQKKTNMHEDGYYNVKYANLADKKDEDTPEEENDEIISFKGQRLKADKEDQTLERYQNFAETQHFLQGNTTIRPSGLRNIDWQLNLRNRNKEKNYKRALSEESKPAWGNYYTRLSKPKSLAEGVNVSEIRNKNLNFQHCAGCEGTNLSVWESLVKDSKKGKKMRDVIRFETTLRENNKFDDGNGAKISHNRHEGCITEMLAGVKNKELVRGKMRSKIRPSEEVEEAIMMGRDDEVNEEAE